jgi:hypothetical protein
MIARPVPVFFNIYASIYYTGATPGQINFVMWCTKGLAVCHTKLMWCIKGLAV